MFVRAGRTPRCTPTPLSRLPCWQSSRVSVLLHRRMSEAMRVCTVEQMRELDGRASSECGISSELLMENAGVASYSVMQSVLGSVARKRCLVVCGAGNNGGDGFVVARKLHSNGARVQVVLLADAAKFQGAAKLNFDISSKLGLETIRLAEGETQKLENLLRDCDVVVDAIFGTGLAREVQGIQKEAINAINASGKTVFALDIPSGINGNTGSVMGVAVKAHYCITFGLPKLGNLLFPGYHYAGKQFVSYISFPPSFQQSDKIQVMISNHKSLPPLPERDPNGHKGSFGQALFLVGASSYYGAPYLSAFSFLKAGGGYSRMAAPASIIPVIASKAPEIVFHPQKEQNGALTLESRDSIMEIASKMDIVVVGPGLSLAEGVQPLVKELVKSIDKPMIIDGDGLTIVASDTNLLRQRKAPTILTPHPGEMSRLMGISVKQVEADRVNNLRKACQDTGCVIVLKGAHSLIGLPDGRIYINMSGNSGMATAGMGDVLCGTIAACHGQGMQPDQAAIKGVFLHGLAGDIAAAELGEGLTAEDVLRTLPCAILMDRTGLDPDLQEKYEGLRVVA